MSAAYEETPTGVVSETPAAAPTMGVGAPGVVILGLLTIVVSAWGGILPYVGALFGYRIDGSPAWVFNLPHGVLALAPGAVGVLAGSLMISTATRVRYGLGRAGLTLAGLLAAASGAWFVIGPSAWRVLDSANYLVGRTPSTMLAHQIGAAFGPGVLLALLGGAAIGWALRHRRLAPGLIVARDGGVPRHLAAVAPPASTQA